MLDEATAEILIVESISADLTLLTNLLTGQGYRVCSAPSGMLALPSIATKMPDLILLDVQTPEQDGYAICRQLKAEPHLYPIPVIFITTLCEATDKAQGFAAGGVDYIAKPFDPAEVLMRVKTHLELRRLQRRLAQTQAELEQRMEMRTKTGEWKWINDRSKVIESDDASHPLRMAGAHVDIAEHKRTEAALQKQVLTLTQPLDNDL